MNQSFPFFSSLLLPQSTQGFGVFLKLDLWFCDGWAQLIFLAGLISCPLWKMAWLVRLILLKKNCGFLFLGLVLGMLNEAPFLLPCFVLSVSSFLYFA